MNILSEFPAVVYLWSIFRDSPDYVSTFLELFPAEQGFATLAAGLVARALYKKLQDKFRK